MIPVLFNEYIPPLLDFIWWRPRRCQVAYQELEDHAVVVSAVLDEEEVFAVPEDPKVVALTVLQGADDVEMPTGGGDDGKAWRQFDPGGKPGPADRFSPPMMAP